MAEAWRGSEGHRDGFAGLGGHFAFQKAPEDISRGLWRPCTPSFVMNKDYLKTNYASLSP